MHPTRVMYRRFCIASGRKADGNLFNLFSPYSGHIITRWPQKNMFAVFNGYVSAISIPVGQPVPY